MPLAIDEEVVELYHSNKSLYTCITVSVLAMVYQQTATGDTDMLDVKMKLGCQLQRCLTYFLA